MSLLDKIPPFFRNVYVLTGIAYLVWMLFLDANRIPNQIETSAKLLRLEDEKAYYQERIEKVQKDRQELLSNPDLLEKFAREKYLMRKPQEDVYIIEEAPEE